MKIKMMIDKRYPFGFFRNACRMTTLDTDVEIRRLFISIIPCCPTIFEWEVDLIREKVNGMKNRGGK